MPTYNRLVYVAVGSSGVLEAQGPVEIASGPAHNDNRNDVANILPRQTKCKTELNPMFPSKLFPVSAEDEDKSLTEIDSAKVNTQPHRQSSSRTTQDCGTIT
jgi:hypothetical protein